MKEMNEIKQEIESAATLQGLDMVYRRYLGKKGELTLALRKLQNLSEEERRERAPELQSLQRMVEEATLERSKFLKAQGNEDALAREWIDVSAPGKKAQQGHLHPLTQVQQKFCLIFTSLGFEIIEGPEGESEWYNFDALNIPQDHPARDLWDTFWLASESEKRKAKSEKLLLRTHTSPVQVRYMESHQPPFRIIVPGRVFRHEASDASHDIQFYQLEGLMVDTYISVAHFKAVIGEFFQSFFGKNAKIRLRPAYFPFVEPGFEVMMSCVFCNTPTKERRNCSVCHGGGSLEMMGAGMVHPNVFKAVGYNPGEWQGFAFGIGVDRVAMMKYQVDDIRLFYSGDLRFLKQF